MYFWHLPSIYFCQFAFICIICLLYFLLSLPFSRATGAGWRLSRADFQIQKFIFLIFSASTIFGCPIYFPRNKCSKAAPRQRWWQLRIFDSPHSCTFSRGLWSEYQLQEQLQKIGQNSKTYVKNKQNTGFYLYFAYVWSLFCCFDLWIVVFPVAGTHFISWGVGR